MYIFTIIANALPIALLKDSPWIHFKEFFPINSTRIDSILELFLWRFSAFESLTEF